MHCPSCGSHEIETNDAGGDAVCVNCSTVVEENAIVSSIEFSEAGGSSSVIGQYVSPTCTKPYGSAGAGRNRGRFGFTRDSRETTLANGRKRITQVANMLKLGSHFVDSAFRLFTLAVEHNFVQGRKTLHIVAACLYIVCRQEHTPIMLIDLSDVLRVNVFDLGKTFVKLHQLLYMKQTLPIVDPALFIQRYAGRLELGDKTHSVCSLAIKITAQMNRDWIQTGRRPAGICAVALQVACNTHGVGRSREDIRRTLRVSEATVTQRMKEFEQTPAALMTIDEFSAAHSSSLGGLRNSDRDSGQVSGPAGELEFDPPSFITNRIKDGSLSKIIEDGRKSRGENSVDDEFEFPVVSAGATVEVEEVSTGGGGGAPAAPQLPQTLEDINMESAESLARNVLLRREAQKSKRKPSVQMQEKERERVEMYREIEEGLIATEGENQLAPVQAAAKADPSSSEKEKEDGSPSHEVSPTQTPTVDSNAAEGQPLPSDEEDDTFSDLDDEELDGFIMSEDEVKKKTAIWTEMNKVYLAQVEAKKKAALEQEAADAAAAAEAKRLEASGATTGSESLTDSAGRRKRKRQSTRLQVRDTPEQGFADVLVKHRLSRKINYEALKDMFADDGSLATPTRASNTSSSEARGRNDSVSAASMSMPPPPPVPVGRASFQR